MTMITATAEPGRTGQYIARIVGFDPSFIFRREFIGTRSGKRGEWTNADVDDAGLYEACDVTPKGKAHRYLLVVKSPETNDEPVILRSDKGDAVRIARALDAGRTIAEIVVVSKSAREGGFVYGFMPMQAVVQQQIGTDMVNAMEACWRSLQRLPAESAWKVLRALRGRLDARHGASPVSSARWESPEDNLIMADIDFGKRINDVIRALGGARMKRTEFAMRFSDAEILAVRGSGPATLKKIRGFLAKHKKTHPGAYRRRQP